MRLPSGLNAALDTVSAWPVSGSPIGLPVSASHSRAVRRRGEDDRGDDALAVGAERRPRTFYAPRGPSRIVACRFGRASFSELAFERADWLAGLGVPQPRRLVVRRGDDALAVGAERRARHSSRMAFERLADWLAGLGVPQPRRAVRQTR